MTNKKPGLFISLATSALVAITMACEKPQESVLEQQTKPNTSTTQVEPTSTKPIEYTKESFDAEMQEKGWKWRTNIGSPLEGFYEADTRQYLDSLRKRGYEVHIDGKAFGKSGHRVNYGNSVWTRKKSGLEQKIKGDNNLRIIVEDASDITFEDTTNTTVSDAELAVFAKRFARADFFDKKAIKKERGIPFYTAEELGDLTDIKIPVTLTYNTNDRGGHWSNDPNTVTDPLVMIDGRINPTHFIYFEKQEDGLYKFDIEPLENQREKSLSRTGVPRRHPFILDIGVIDIPGMGLETQSIEDLEREIGKLNRMLEGTGTETENPKRWTKTKGFQIDSKYLLQIDLKSLVTEVSQREKRQLTPENSRALDEFVREISQYDKIHFGETHPQESNYRTAPSPSEDWADFILTRLRDPNLVDNPYTLIRTEYLFSEIDSKGKRVITQSELDNFDDAETIDTEKSPTVYLGLTSGISKDTRGTVTTILTAYDLGYKLRGLSPSIGMMETLEMVGKVLNQDEEEKQAGASDEIIAIAQMQLTDKTYLATLNSMGPSERVVIHGGGIHNDHKTRWFPFGIADEMGVKFPGEYVAIDIVKPSFDRHTPQFVEYHEILRGLGHDPNNLTQVVWTKLEGNSQADYVLFLPK